MRSVKTWPRSRSAPSWTSSMATKATSRSRGIASTVETQKRGFGGLIFSSPVISATLSAPTRSTHLVVDLARQQPQRQPDHAGGMRQHALDGEMGLAGIGRPQHGGDAGAAGARGAVGLRGKGDGHYASRLAAGLFAGPARGFLYHNATHRRRLAPVKLWNESGTNRARIADSGAMRLRSRRHLASGALSATRSGSPRPIQAAVSSRPNVNADGPNCRGVKPESVT